MFSYIIGLLAMVIFLYNPIIQLISPDSSIRRQSFERPLLNESFVALESANDTSLECPAHSYRLHVLSKAPLVFYVENFLSSAERSHLLEISEPYFENSTITHDGVSTQRDTTVRTSEVALVPRTPTVRCIEARARALQGWPPEVWVERLRTQRYVPGGHYSHHFDWSSNAAGWGRVSSFMVWVAADDGLEGGGTEFPLLTLPGSAAAAAAAAAGADGEEDAVARDMAVRSLKQWCRFVECPSFKEGGPLPEMPRGVTFKPIVGNAVYWENFMADGSGRGHDETWHAGLPVKRGVKVGLNIWSWGRIN